MNKKIKVIMFSMLSVLLISCGENNNTDIDSLNVETQEINEENSYEENMEIITEENSAQKEEIQDLVKLKELESENDILNIFYKELIILQENKLNEAFLSLNNGDSHKRVMEVLDEYNFRYDEEVQLIYLLDEAGNILNMENRTGIVAFTDSNLDLETETSTLINKLDEVEEISNDLNMTEVVEEVVEESIESLELEESKIYQKINVKEDVVYNSYIVFTFNENNVLVGKFKNLDSSVNNGYTLNETIINGRYEVEGISLKISKDSDTTTIYEKQDEVRYRIEENNKEIEEIIKNLSPDFNNIYNNLTTDTTHNEFISEVFNAGFNIEKMNDSQINTINNRFKRNYEDGYFISMSKDEEHISPDLRYKDLYIKVVFNDEGRLYYMAKMDENGLTEECDDIKDYEDYTLNEIYTNILEIQDTIDSLNEEKLEFVKIIDKNIALLNSNLLFDESKTSILIKVKEAGLDYYDNYRNLSVSSYRNYNNDEIKAFDDLGNNTYDECLLVYGGTKDIYLFFEDSLLIGIYKTDYFDIAEVDIDKYMNLGTTKTSISKIETTIQNELREIASLEEMLETRIKTFIKSIGYADNHEENQIYNKQDIIEGLSLGGFEYEEGINNADKMHFIKIYKKPGDSDYYYKIYFNEYGEVETIQQ